MDCSRPGSPVPHYLMEFAQTHVHGVNDAIQPPDMKRWLIRKERSWCWGRLRARGEGDDRGWDGWMTSPSSLSQCPEDKPQGWQVYWLLGRETAFQQSLRHFISERKRSGYYVIEWKGVKVKWSNVWVTSMRQTGVSFGSKLQSGLRVLFLGNDKSRYQHKVFPIKTYVWSLHWGWK